MNCVFLCVYGFCEVACAFICVRKWHMLAVGGSAGKAGWLIGVEPESGHLGKRAFSIQVCTSEG